MAGVIWRNINIYIYGYVYVYVYVYTKVVNKGSQQGNGVEVQGGV